MSNHKIEIIKTTRGLADLEVWNIIERELVYLFRVKSKHTSGRDVEILAALIMMEGDLYAIVDVNTGLFLHPYNIKSLPTMAIAYSIVKIHIDTLLVAFGYEGLQAQFRTCKRRLKESTGRDRLNEKIVDSLTPNKCGDGYSAKVELVNSDT